MDYQFEQKYLAKLLLSLVQDEGRRIVSQGLAKREELCNLVGSTLKYALKGVVGENRPDVLLKALGTVHTNLSDVKLPGDFDKAKGQAKDSIYIIFDVPSEEEDVFDFSKLLEVVEDKYKEVCEEDSEEEAKAPEKEEGSDKEESPDEEDEDEERKKLSGVIVNLEKIVYKFGRRGDHASAYFVEKTIRKLKDSLGE